MITLPRLYAIIDPALSQDPSQTGIASYAREMIEGGVTLIQLRCKSEGPKKILSYARELRRVADLNAGVRLVMNDRADYCLAADFDGVHMGQDDLSPEGARKVVGPERWLGVSTHNLEQVSRIEKTSADYIAIGPVFETTTKINPDPVIGLEGVRAARAATSKPLVAIGGITLENCRSVIEAGADSVAIISALLRAPRKRSEEFFCRLG